VLRDVRNNIVAQHAIIDLVRLAQAHNIMLIPIGCKTAIAGSPIGSTRNITTNDIVAMLNKLREKNSSLRDVFAALQAVGDVQINFNWTGKAIEAMVLDSKNKVAKVHFSFAPGIVQPSAFTQQWEKEINDAQELNQQRIEERITAIYGTGVGRLRLMIMDHSIYTWLISWVGPFIYSVISDSLSHLEYFRLDRNRIYQLVFLRYGTVFSAVVSLIVFMGGLLWVFGFGLIGFILIIVVISVVYYFLSEFAKNVFNDVFNKAPRI
jgi:hypothetical protein